MDYRQIITIEPAKMGEKPCIRGMRMTVYDVLDYLASGMAESEILNDFPYLGKTQQPRARGGAGVPAADTNLDDNTRN